MTQAQINPKDSSILNLTTGDRLAIQEATLQDFSTEGWRHIEAAIFIAGTTYIYKRRSDTQPTRFKYTCLSPKTLQRAFHLERIDSGWLDPGVIRCGFGTVGEWAVLFIPPHVQPLSIKLEASPGLTSLVVPLPGLVMLGIGAKYWLWATSAACFEADAVVYQPPLPNVHDDGRICWGSHTPPPVSPQTLDQAWKLFVTSSFNDHLSQGKSRCHSHDVTEQLRDLNHKHRKTYPIKDLVPYRPGYHPMNFDDLIGQKIQ